MSDGAEMCKPDTAGRLAYDSWWPGHLTPKFATAPAGCVTSQHVVIVWEILTLSVATLTPSPLAISSTCSVKANRTACSIGHVCQNFGAGAVVLEAGECPSLENVFLTLPSTQQLDM